MHRRTFLRAAGVAVALPSLEAMTCRAQAAASKVAPKRMVVMCTTLGLYGPSLFPDVVGADYKLTPYLQPLKGLRDQFTLFSGLSHPDQSGADGHSGSKTWLTTARHPGLAGFRNTISLDQYVREKIGYVTRFPSLILSTGGGSSQSYTRSGVMIPARHQPSGLFEDLFLQGKPREVDLQRKQLSDGQSILDSLGSQTKRLAKRVSMGDRHRLQEYYDSIRATEKQFVEANAWLDRPKPIVDVEPPKDIEDQSDILGRMRLMLGLVPLIIQTDSSRMIAIVVQGGNGVPPIKGVSSDYHNLSHHGQDEAKIEQLRKIEKPQMELLGEFLTTMQSKHEGETNLLENTMVMFGSNLGNANSHDWRNLPILLAGGGLDHGRYVAYDKENNTPLANLFVTMLQHMGIESDRFGSSTRALGW